MYLNYLTLFTSLAVMAAHGSGILFDLYSKYPNFDMLVHFLGGAFVANALIFFAYRHSKFSFFSQSKLTNIIVTMGLTALVGVLWEFLEFLLYFLAYAPIQTYTDTLSDLFFDIIGSLSVALIAFVLFKISSAEKD